MIVTYHTWGYNKSPRLRIESETEFEESFLQRTLDDTPLTENTKILQAQITKDLSKEACRITVFLPTKPNPLQE